MKYKLVAIDLDGTLLDDRKKIPEKNKNVLKILDELGVEIVIATGRRYYSAKEFGRQLDIDLVIMSNNGTIVRHMRDDSLLVNRYFNKEDFYNIIREGKKRCLNAITHVDNYFDGYDIVIEHDKESEDKYSTYLKDILERYKRVDNILEYPNPKALAVVYTGNLEDLKDFKEKLNLRYKDKYKTYLMQNLLGVGPILEVIHYNTSKWISLLDYASQKDIKKEEILSIGDDNNDLEMIINSGLGIGMKNGSKEITKAADIITDKTNNEAGLGYILEKVFKL